MRKRVIKAAKKYTENGEEKKKWYPYGKLKETQSGGEYIILNHQPYLELQIFEEDGRRTIKVAKRYKIKGENQKNWYPYGSVKETHTGGEFITVFHQPDLELQIFEELDHFESNE